MCPEDTHKCRLGLFSGGFDSDRWHSQEQPLATRTGVISPLPPPPVTHFCMNSFSIPSIWPSNAGRISFALLYALFFYWAVFNPHPKKSHPETLIKIFSFWQKHLQGAGKKGQLVKHLSCKPEDLSSNLNSHMKRRYSPEILALGMQWQADAWSCRHSQISEVQIQ